MPQHQTTIPLAYRFGPLIEDERTRFRLWAPGAAEAQLVLQRQTPTAMDKTPDGFFEATAECGRGTRYKFRIGNLEFPDLASRQQDGDTSGWSVVREQLVPPADFSRPWHEMVVCEVHIGAATPRERSPLLLSAWSTSETRVTPAWRSCRSTSVRAPAIGVMTGRSFSHPSRHTAAPKSFAIWWRARMSSG